MKFKTVPPYKPRKLPSKIMFVGEAPADEEIIRGEPLVGPSGRVFRAALRTAGLDPEAYWITNVFNEQAPDNDASLFQRDKEKTAAAFARLAGEIEEAKPNVIVPMGATALWAFGLGTSITPYRGAVSKATRIVPGAKLVPTFHPSHIIRGNWKHFPTITRDFIRAADESRTATISYPRLALNIQPTLEEVLAWEPKLKAADILSTDIETGWGQITCIGFAPNASEAICIPFVDFGKPDRNYWRTADEEFAALRSIERVLDAPNPKLFQNGPYDVTWIAKRWKMMVRNYSLDTRLLHQALFPELPKDLAFMGTYTKIGSWKNWGGRYSSANKRDE